MIGSPNIFELTAGGLSERTHRNLKDDYFAANAAHE
jgi:hypothetical protein